MPVGLGLEVVDHRELCDLQSAGFGVTFSDDGIVRSITRHRTSTGGDQPSIETQTETMPPLPDPSR